ncbi:serine/threonine protein kinase [Phormidium tenue FACHB-886]|nr:serine/threonine protein kinase [Phormidium tenue FACHB-886]
MIGQLLANRYLILERLGAGGFSETYLARDKYLPHHPLCVVKCLKVSPGSTLSSETAQALFETEARILDRLGRQCNQIPVLLAYDQQEAYQIQEYIDGENLGNWLAQGQSFNSSDALDLLMEVLPILSYIHSQQVIHRDITPSNLIRRPDGQIMLIDFGAACVAGADSKQEDIMLAIGTPGYMSAEQAAGTAQFNSDLYGLGMSVIHLLTQVDPQQIQVDPISGELEWQTHLKEQSLDPMLQAVLERMVRNRSRDRYQTADEALAALKPFSKQKRKIRLPIQLPSMRQLSKSTVALLLVGTLTRYFSDQLQPVSFATLNLLNPATEMQLTPLRDLPMQSGLDQMLITPDDRTLVTAEANHTLRLWALPTGAQRRSMAGHADTVTALETSSNSKLLVSGSKDRTVRLWNIETGVRMRTFTGHQSAVTAVAISPDMRTIASGSKDGTLRLWDSQTGKLLRSLAVPKTEITAVAFDATSTRLISASSDQQIEVWDWQAGQIQRRFVGHTDAIVGLRVKDDQTLFSFGKDRTLVWDLDREELVRVFSEDSAKPVTALVDKDYITTVHDNGNIRIWTHETGRLIMTISGLGQNLDATLSPNRRYLVSWSPPHPLRLWQLSAVP